MANRSNQALPAKEQALMRTIVKLHDNKQHKKGLKSCEAILKKYPEHGEALAMKALFFSGLDRRDEAHETVKKAIKNDIGNHVCWHAYGLIHRAEKNYEECIKCYSQALKIDKENINIYRDFASMQMQLRNTEAYVDACLSIILLRPGFKQFWLALAAAFHVANNFEASTQSLTLYHDLFQTHVENNVEYENSEIYMYRAMVLEESGDLKAALEMIDSHEKSILDKKSAKEARARLLLKMGESKQAESAYKALVKINPDSYSALEGLQKAKGLDGDLDDAKTAKLFEMFEDLLDEHRRSNAIKRMPLNSATGERFTRMVDSFLRFNFQKGVPSVFMSVRALYTDPSKLETIQSLCLSYVKNLTAHSQFTEPVAAAPSAEDEDDVVVMEPPSAVLWVYYYLAQHYDFLGDGVKALSYIELAIQHTPTLVELFMTKARILKHAGDLQQAMEVMNYGRNLDLQDRCINSKCVKYMLRAGDIAEADRTVILFCRVDSIDKLQDLVDMQCSWFAYETAMAYIAKGEFAKALKRFHQIEKFFYDMYDDQFDFHTYSIRKSTLRTYIDLVRMEDQLRAHPFYFKAAVEAVKLYLTVYENRISDDKKKDAEMSQMSEADRKKALRKARKAELKSAGDENASTANGSKGSLSGSATSLHAATGNKKKADEDPDGIKLFNEPDLLGESMRFLKPLLELSSARIETQVLACAVYLKKKKYVLAVKALKKGYKISATDPELHRLAMTLSHEVQTAEMSAQVKAIVLETLSQVLGSSYANVKTLNAEYAKTHKNSLLHAVSVAQVSQLVDASNASKAVDAVVAISAQKGFKLEDAVQAHKALVGKLAASESQVAQFVKNCVKAYPLATCF
ncbi:NMDA receptor-regulated protein 1-domain-containing protein [Chytriomyces cf. hyalinus JEL632]|nr:NMDA receptor-regulated protein 1-domain-containing protein [Chytriomyces cf. hyalinus JEL632]